MNKMISAAVAKVGFFYDVNTDTLYVSTAFDKKRLQYGSDEYKKVREFRAICPDLKMEVVKRAPKKKPLSYEMMKKFISVLPTAEADLKEMERQQMMSVAYKSPYKYMELWFNEKYPNHKELLVKSDDNKVEWDAVALMRLADTQKKEKAEVQAQTAGATSEAVTQSSITELPTSKDVVEAA